MQLEIKQKDDNFNKYKIALLMGLFPSESYDFILSNSKGVIQYAADALQKSILKGFCNTINIDHLHLINLPYVSGYPSFFKTPYIPSHNIQVDNKNIGYNYSFYNIWGYKNFSRYLHARKAISDWYNNTLKDRKIIVVYALHTPFLKACIDVKKRHNDLKVIQIVPDLPQYMGGKNNILHSINNKILKDLYNHVDGWVLLSEHMKELLPIKNNYTVVEGIYSDNVEHIGSQKDDTFRIFYAGTLAKRYGIMNLVKAVNCLSIKNLELNICGDGDAREEIEQLQNIDNRIIYRGQLPRCEVLQLLQSSDLLVNPRTPEGEFTKYSFPSKTMEYLASGIPTLLYKLPGIPSEYYDYCFSLDELGIDKLSTKIQHIYEMDTETRNKLGQKAKEFILEKKNPKMQVGKIVSLIESLL